MQKYVHKIEEFEELFEKLKFGNEKYGAIYSAIMFKLEDSSRLADFSEFILKYVRISDTIFSIPDDKVLLILEETTIRGALNFAESLAKKIKEKGFTYKYYCSAIQGDYIEKEKQLIKALKKRIKKAKKEKIKNCVIDL